MPIHQPTLFASDTERHTGVGLWMCVLASGSSGNCTALVIETPAGRRIVLIDLGLSPRRTSSCLGALGLDLDQVEIVLFTHLDTDHWNPAWIGKIPGRATVAVHRSHRRRAERDGLMYHRTEVFTETCELPGGFLASVVLASHDELGSAVFRIRRTAADADSGELGFATDVGRATPPIVEHLRGVDVLAIESNYCPRLQAESARPEFLKRRIMDGHGHLSNEQCARAVQEIKPRRDLVLLHLSRQCNDPRRAMAAHLGAPYRVTLTSHAEPSDVVVVTSRAEQKPPVGPVADRE